jgi:tape measure domain-containing protein
MARSSPAAIGNLAVDLTMNTASFSRGAKVAQTQLSGVQKSFATASKSIEGAQARITQSMKGIAASLGVLGVGAAGRTFLSLADQSKQMTASLKLATAQVGNFAQAQKDVARLAGETRSGLVETAALYGNFLRNAQDLGINQTEAARATETFSKAMKISGATATDASQGTRQFVQALQSGVLRGDEFNSIMENSPRLARLLSESLDVPIGSLRKMAEEGELTSDKLVKALTDRKFTTGIDEEFRQMPVTFSEAMQQINNAAITTFGEFDRGGDFSTMLSNFVVDGSKGFADLGARALEFGVQTRATIAGLSSAFSPLYSATVAFFDFFEGQAAKSGINIKRDIQKSLADIDRFTGFVAQSWNESIFSPKRLLFNPGMASGTNFGGRNQAASAASARQSRARLADSQLQASIGYKGGIGSASDLYLRGPATGGGRPTAVDPAGAKKADAEAKKRQRELEKAANEARKLQERLDGAFLSFRPDTIDQLEMAQGSIAEMALDSSFMQNAMTEVDFAIGKVGESLMEAKRKSDEFVGSLADGLADALVFGGNLGDVLVNSFKRAAAEALSNGLFDLLRGGAGGIGGLLSSAGSLFGGGQTAAQLGINDYGRTGLPGFAKGGVIGGFGGVDKNLLSINGIPTARVGRGEQLRIEPNNDNGSRRALSVHVTPSPYFNVAVQEVAAPMVQQGMVGAVGMGEARQAQRARRRLG